MCLLLIKLEGSQGHDNSFICVFFINDGVSSCLKAHYRQAIGNRNITFALSKMNFIFYTIIIDENTEHINGNGYL